MPKMNIADAAEFFGVSKEAIHNRIRRGSLKSVIVGSEKNVIIDKSKQYDKTAKKTNLQTDEKYYKYLETQNEKLQEKIEKLEGETRSLRDQKEQMLIQERQKIEKIYKDKDEQLKNILNTISAKFMLQTPNEHLDVEIEDVKPSLDTTLTSLNKYLKSRNFSKKKRDKIKTKFDKRYKGDDRIIKLNKKYYIDLKKYDYSEYSL
ncbi:MAG: DNA-binding protein [Sulfurimonas sp.]|nr:DNA-binding protein [Sulfurimonas sp.]